MVMVPEVTEREYPPVNAPVTVSVTVPEAVPLTALDPPTIRYSPLTLVKVMVWPVVRIVGVGMMMMLWLDEALDGESAVPLRGTRLVSPFVGAAIAG
jgi:hypothetical protein